MGWEDVEGIVRQVRFAGLQSSLDFRFDYRQDKTNEAADALSRFSSEEPGQGGRSSKSRILQSFVGLRQHLGYLFFNPSAPNSYLRNARPPFVISILEMRSGRKRPSPEMLDGWEDVKGVVHHQGLSYVPEIIKTELTIKKTCELVARKS